MAINKIRGNKLYIKVGNGASPEVFAHPCLINAKRGIKFTTSANKIIVPDCDNIDDPAWQEVIKYGRAASINGAGKLDTGAVASYDAWHASADGKNVQVWLGTVGYWEGRFQLTDFEINGDEKDVAEATIALESDGPVTAFTPA